MAKNETKISDRYIVETIKQDPEGSQAQELKEMLYNRYANFVHKHWHALTRQLNSSQLVQESKDDFYGESYVSFSKALEAIDVKKILNDDWKFLGYFGFYLSNQRNTFAKRMIQKYQMETTIEITEPVSSNQQHYYLSDLSEKGIVPSAEESFLQDDQRRRFWDGLSLCRTKTWGNVENTIFNMREKGESIKIICDTLSISSWKYNKILETMKSQLESATAQA